MSENEILEKTKENFPELSSQIDKQFMECEVFREICEDYVLCLNSIRKIESQNPAKKEEYLEEFREALMALEDELLSKVKKDKTSQNTG